MPAMNERRGTTRRFDYVTAALSVLLVLVVIAVVWLALIQPAA